MTLQKHGLSIGLERTGNEFFLTLRPVGKLTHEDYEIITPMIDAALDGFRKPQVSVLLDARNFEGWEARAAWDDFRLGLKYSRTFDKVAIVGNKNWQKNMARLAGWFVAGEAQFFESADDALAWLGH